jgi:hypothetical protein
MTIRLKVEITPETMAVDAAYDLITVANITLVTVYAEFNRSDFEVKPGQNAATVAREFVDRTGSNVQMQGSARS